MSAPRCFECAKEAPVLRCLACGEDLCATKDEKARRWCLDEHLERNTNHRPTDEDETGEEA